MGILPCKLGCPLLQYMETVGSFSGQLSRQLTTSKYEKMGSSVDSGVGCPWELCHAYYAAHYFHIWKHWAASVGSSVGSPLLRNMKKWAAQWTVEWAANGNFAVQTSLPTSSIYGNIGQLGGQPITSKYESGQLGRHWSRLPMGFTWEFCHTNDAAHFFHIWKWWTT